jgi:hypothetical protein
VKESINGRTVDQARSDGSAPLLRELCSGLAQLLDAERVEVVGDRVCVLFDNADFVLRPITGESGVLEVHWTVTVRESPPNLGTWWTDWRSRHERTTELTTEVAAARTRIRRMLVDHATGVQLPRAATTSTSDLRVDPQRSSGRCRPVRHAGHQ